MTALTDHQLRTMRSSWHLQAQNCLREGQQIPLPPSPLLRCALDASEAAQWRGSVAQAIRSCSDLPPLPDEWKQAREAQQAVPNGDRIAAELRAYREQMQLAEAQGDDASDAGNPEASPATGVSGELSQSEILAQLHQHRREVFGSRR